MNDMPLSAPQAALPAPVIPARRRYTLAQKLLAAAVLLLIPSVFGAAGTYINYDILTYLPPELDSMVGEGYLEDDFNMASVSMITVENMTTADTLKLKAALSEIEGVQSVMWTSDIVDATFQ